MLRRSSHAASFAIAAVTVAAVASFAPSGCFYPDYTFNQPEPSGSGGAGASGGSSSTVNPTTSTTSNGGGGSGASQGGGGAGPGSGGATTSGSGGFGAGGPEDCSNGIDDNDDGLIDCEDPQCGDFACVSDVPTADGWTGYFALYDGDANTDPGCPDEFPSDVTPPFLANRQLDAPPADCKCTCNPPTGGSCQYPANVIVNDAPCGSAANCGSQLALPAGWNGSCTGSTYAPGDSTCGPNAGATCEAGTAPCSVSVTVPAATVTEGTCTPKPMVKTFPDVTWQKLGRGCGDPVLTAGGCNTGLKCLPKPAAPFVTGVCVMKPGLNSCPTGFTQRHVFYDDFDDQRTCGGSCSCNGAGGSTCTAKIRVYSNLTIGICQTQVGPEFTSGTCTNITGNPNVAGRTGTIGSPVGGTCPGTGGVPSGEVTETNATTFCCKQ